MEIAQIDHFMGGCAVLKKKEQRKRMLKELEGAVSFYSKAPLKRRAVTTGYTCGWIDHCGRKCAVGRRMRKGIAQKSVNARVNSPQMLESYYGSMDEILVPSAQGLSMAFWNALIELHDNWRHWNLFLGGRGLTEKGVEYCRSMTDKIKKGVFDNVG
jgi:hypothetical protein